MIAESQTNKSEKNGKTKKNIDDNRDQLWSGEDESESEYGDDLTSKEEIGPSNTKKSEK